MPSSHHNTRPSPSSMAILQSHSTFRPKSFLLYICQLHSCKYFCTYIFCLCCLGSNGSQLGRFMVLLTENSTRSSWQVLHLLALMLLVATVICCLFSDFLVVFLGDFCVQIWLAIVLMCARFFCVYYNRMISTRYDCLKEVRKLASQ